MVILGLTRGSVKLHIESAVALHLIIDPENVDKAPG